MPPSVITDAQRDRILKEMYKRPNPLAKKVYNHYGIDRPREVFEMDLLFLPTDTTTTIKDVGHGARYALCVVDCASRYKMVFPLKDKKSLVDELDKMIKTKVGSSGASTFLKPAKINTDAGSEFKNKAVQDWAKKNDIIINYLPTGHHLSLVENFNGYLARHIFKNQATIEFDTGKPNKAWVNYIKPFVIDENNRINPITGLRPKDAIRKSIVPIQPNDIDKSISEKTYPIGTLVRRLLDKNEILDIPTMTIKGDRRRSTDPIWSFDVYQIIQAVQPEGGLWQFSLQDVHTKKVYPVSYNYYQLQKTIGNV